MAHTRNRGWSAVSLEQDEGSGARNLQSPGMQRLISRIQAGGVDVLLVHSLDRLTTSVGDLHRLLNLLVQSGVALISLQESLDSTTPEGDSTLQVLKTVTGWGQVLVEKAQPSASEEAPHDAALTLPLTEDRAHDAASISVADAPRRQSALGSNKPTPSQSPRIAEGYHSDSRRDRSVSRAKAPSSVGHSLITPEQVAEQLQISRLTVMDYLRKGVLRGVKVGRLWRVREADLMAFLAERDSA